MNYIELIEQAEIERAKIDPILEQHNKLVRTCIKEKTQHTGKALDTFVKFFNERENFFLFAALLKIKEKGGSEFFDNWLQHQFEIADHNEVVEISDGLNEIAKIINPDNLISNFDGKDIYKLMQCRPNVSPRVNGATEYGLSFLSNKMKITNNGNGADTSFGKLRLELKCLFDNKDSNAPSFTNLDIRKSDAAVAKAVKEVGDKCLETFVSFFNNINDNVSHLKSWLKKWSSVSYSLNPYRAKPRANSTKNDRFYTLQEISTKGMRELYDIVKDQISHDEFNNMVCIFAKNMALDLINAEFYVQLIDGKSIINDFFNTNFRFDRDYELFTGYYSNKNVRKNKRDEKSDFLYELYYDAFSSYFKKSDYTVFSVIYKEKIEKSTIFIISKNISKSQLKKYFTILWPDIYDSGSHNELRLITNES